MDGLEDIAGELARLGGDGSTRFHFDPAWRPARRIDDERAAAWTARNMGTVEGRAAMTAAVICEQIAPATAGTSTMPQDFVAMTGIALRSLDASCAEFGVEVDDHQTTDQMVRVLVFHLVRMVAAERVEKSAAVHDRNDVRIEALLAGGLDAMRDTASILRTLILRTLRAEAATNLAIDVLAGGSLPTMRSSVEAVIDELPWDEPLRDTMIRLHDALRRLAEDTL